MERDFRKTCLSNEKNSNSSPELKEAYQEYVKAYTQNSSFYRLQWYSRSKSNLIIYDTENETSKMISLKIPKMLDHYTAITRLPNCELFCYGNRPLSGITLIIDRNYNFRKLPSGTPVFESSCIYYNKNVYCFGGYLEETKYPRYSNLFNRFDLEKNGWFKLTPLPTKDQDYSIAIFNNNFLIAGVNYSNIWSYSTEIEAWSMIDYSFVADREKLLLNVGDRLFCIWWNYDVEIMYESEVGDEYSWKTVTNYTGIANCYRASYVYNKGVFYIGAYDELFFKFDLHGKHLSEHTVLKPEKSSCFIW